MIEISAEDASEFMSGLGSPGVCLGCKMVDEHAGCEPDAEGYNCPSCGEDELCGFEQALMMGHITITE